MVQLDKEQTALNGICPYFTMFPLDFPLGVLSRYATEEETVLDPFCGRGTTNFAARLLGLRSVGIDSSPVAAAISASKLIHTTPEEISAEAISILETERAVTKPTGEFWELAYHANILDKLCRFRSAFLQDCTTPVRIALRGVILGALHGPTQKTIQSYFSNQCPRTYAPKPAYATKYWKVHSFQPPEVDILEVINRRAERYYSTEVYTGGTIRMADSRKIEAFDRENSKDEYSWIITSPPYYGMRTYIPDQWLRHWFVGGPSRVDYSSQSQLLHSSPDEFVGDIRKVWNNVAEVSSSTANLVIRFGGIADRSANPKDIIRRSMKDSGWRISTIKPAGTASHGRRQADTFLRKKSKPLEEYVIWAKRSLCTA